MNRPNLDQELEYDPAYVAPGSARSRFDAHFDRALGYARVFETIDPAAWTRSDMESLASRPAGDHEELKCFIDQLLAQHDETVRERLIEQLRSGSLQALDSLPDVRLLSPADVKPVVQVLRERLIQQQDEALQGAYRFGGRDLARTLTLLNMWHPDAADWEPIIDLLTAPLTAAHQLTGTLSVLSSMPDQVPTPVAGRIVPLLRAWMTRVPVQNPFDHTDVRGLVADALNVLRPDALTNEDLWSLIGGNRGRPLRTAYWCDLQGVARGPLGSPCDEPGERQ